MTVATIGRIKNARKATILPPCAAVIDGRRVNTPHKEMKDQLTNNDMSCLTCHSKIHDVANIDKTKKWKGPGA